MSRVLKKENHTTKYDSLWDFSILGEETHWVKFFLIKQPKVQLTKTETASSDYTELQYVCNNKSKLQLADRGTTWREHKSCYCLH